MLAIRAEQMAAIERSRWSAFVDRACAYAQLHWPTYPDLRASVEHALSTARAYDIETEFDLLRYVSIALTLGATFVEDRRFPWAADILQSPTYGAHTKVDLLWQMMLAEFGELNDPELAPDLDDDEPDEAEETGADQDVMLLEEELPPAEPESEDPGELPPDIEVDTDADDEDIR